MKNIFTKISLRSHYLALALPRYLRGHKKQPQIIFIHVPKAAGSSINRYIRHSVAPLLRKSHAILNEFDYIDGLDLRDQQISKARQACYVYGHMAWETMEAVREGHRAYVFTMLREPASRLRSNYFFIKHLAKERLAIAIGDEELSAQLPDISPLEFFTAQHPRMRLGLDNFMVRQFCGDFYSKPQSDDDWRGLLERAKTNLQQLDYVGFQERFDDDFRAITIGAGLPPVKYIPKVNITKSLISRKAASSVPHEEFDDDEKRAIEPLIRWDRQLYDFARETLPV
ncbi:MAG: sulfotransferase family protein [bacterium]|nr:sulfotransferase family protein [bacterium]